MAGTKAGSKKALATIKLRHGTDFFIRIGKMGGAKSKNGGFGSTKVGADGLTGQERARLVGAKGGSASKRGKANG